jgi:phosphatidylinositol kinase/protein kinase (PI-3  family)
MIDFECIFDQGERLPVPERVPFRLTPELEDAMGIYGSSGEFSYVCQVVLEALRDYKDTVTTVFEGFMPDIKRSRELTIRQNMRNEKDKSVIKIIANRLIGVQEYGSANMFQNLRTQVRALILAATNLETLREMFKGWMPWM